MGTAQGLGHIDNGSNKQRRRRRGPDRQSAGMPTRAIRALPRCAQVTGRTCSAVRQPKELSDPDARGSHGRLVGARPDTPPAAMTATAPRAGAGDHRLAHAPDCGWLLIPRSMSPARRHDPRPVRLTPGRDLRPARFIACTIGAITRRRAKAVTANWPKHGSNVSPRKRPCRSVSRRVRAACAAQLFRPWRVVHRAATTNGDPS